jgi:hypothetical protein
MYKFFQIPITLDFEKALEKRNWDDKLLILILQESWILNLNTHPFFRASFLKNKKRFWKTKILVKNSKFWPIVKNAIGLKLLFTLFLATMGQNSTDCMTKSAKNSQFIVKITRYYHYGPISQKVLYRIFWRPPKVPYNFPLVV